LKAIDPDWNPQWPADWQRHYAAVREMLVEESMPVSVEPGVTVHGMDVGRWLERQRRHDVWHRLTDGQRKRLQALSAYHCPRSRKPLRQPARAAPVPSSGVLRPSRQYKNREAT
jgi:hypothetical protein